MVSNVLCHDLEGSVNEPVNVDGVHVSLALLADGYDHYYYFSYIQQAIYLVLLKLGQQIIYRSNTSSRLVHI